MSELPIVIIGAGPVGLAAAAHARRRGVPAVVMEAGHGPASAVREWGHVRLFSPWRELIDDAARDVLMTTGWQEPPAADCPTGEEWVERYLAPLADALNSSVSDSVRYGMRVTGVARRGRDVVVDEGRDAEPFVVHVATFDGVETIEARAVIDASGVWREPNPLGADGFAARGEFDVVDRISYRIPDLDDPAVRRRYAGRHVVVAGSGDSAKNALIALAALAEEDSRSRITWLLRRPSAAGAFGGQEKDQLAGRGELGRVARSVTQHGVVAVTPDFRVAEVRQESDGSLTVVSTRGAEVAGVDEVLALTGFRPDLSMVSQVRLALDPVLQAPVALAPLIDPNVHSCGTVRPHGVVELAHPERDVFIAGMKSYDRAPPRFSL